MSRLSFIYTSLLTFWLIATHGDKWEWCVCEQWRCLLLSLTATLFKYWFLRCIFNILTYFCLRIITYMNGLAPGSTSKNFSISSISRLNATIVIVYKLHTAHFLYKSIKVYVWLEYECTELLLNNKDNGRMGVLGQQTLLLDCAHWWIRWGLHTRMEKVSSIFFITKVEASSPILRTMTVTSCFVSLAC